MGAVYVLVNLPKGRFYVGSAKDWRVRLREHRAMLQGKRHPNRFLQNDWVKTSPDGWRFLILEDEIPENLLLAHEQVYLSKVFDNQDRCYNIMPLARKNSLGVKRGQETKDRISRANSGKKRSLEQTRKMREERQKTVGLKMFQYDLQGRFLRSFPGLNEAVRQTGIKKPTIRRHTTHKTSTHAGGFLWTLDPQGRDISEKVERYRKTHPEPLLVVGYDPITGEIKTPARTLELCHTQVQAICDPKNTDWWTYQGLVWRKVGEPFDLQDYNRKKGAVLRGFRGRHTEQAKKKVSETKSTPVEGLDPKTGEWSLRFGSCKEAARGTGTSYGTVLRHCNGKVQFETKKWRWTSI